MTTAHKSIGSHNSTIGELYTMISWQMTAVCCSGGDIYSLDFS